MSIRLSIVIRPVSGGATAPAEHAPTATVRPSMTTYFMGSPSRSKEVYVSFALSSPRMTDAETRLARLAAERWRLAVWLTATMTIVYVAFILLIAFNKPLLGQVLAPGLSLGILLGVLVIVVAWAIIVVYVRWANRHYDAAVEAVRTQQRSR